MPTIDEAKNVRDLMKTAGNTLLTNLSGGRYAEGVTAWRAQAEQALIQTVKGQDVEATKRLAYALGVSPIETLATAIQDIHRAPADPSQKAEQLSKIYKQLGESIGQYNSLTFHICAKATSVPNENARPADKSLDECRLEHIMRL